MSHVRPRGGALALVLVAWSAVAHAQSADPSTTGRLELSAGAGWWSGYGLGQVSVPQPGGGGRGAPLFEADASIGGSAAVTARVGWRVWRTLVVEGAATFSRPSLHQMVQSDVEPALNGALETPFHQLAAEAGLLVPLRRLAMREGRVVPFVSGGGGYLRQTYDDGLLLETGKLAYGGLGVRWGAASARPDRFVEHLGWRLEGRLVLRSGGIDVEDAIRPSALLTAGFFIRF